MERLCLLVVMVDQPPAVCHVDSSYQEKPCNRVKEYNIQRFRGRGNWNDVVHLGIQTCFDNQTGKGDGDAISGRKSQVIEYNIFPPQTIFTTVVS